MNKNKSFYESFKRIAFAFCAVLLGIFGVANAANLPTGYTEYEYLVFDGASYVDTEIVLTNPQNIEHVVEMKLTGNTGNFQTIAGFMPSPSISPRYGFHAYSGKWMIGINETLSGGVTVNTDPHTLHFITTTTKQTLYDTDETTILTQVNSLNSSALQSNTLSIYIGARHTGTNTANNFVTGRIGYNYLKQNGTMLYEFIPAKRDSDNALGFYDKVSKKFKPAAGGVLTPGPVVSDPCRNLADMTVSNIDIGHYISSSGVYSESTSNFIYAPFIPVQPNTTYTLSWGDMELYFVTISEYSAANDAGFIIRKTGTTGGNYNLTITTGATTHYVRFGSNLYGNSNTVTLAQVQALTWQFEQGSTATIYVPYCASTGGIKIATTKYNEDAFADLITTLNSAITKVTNVVDTTVAQATSIGTLATTKQDRPADGDCPAGRKCLLVTGTDGKPHWYLIQE